MITSAPTGTPPMTDTDFDPILNIRIERMNAEFIKYHLEGPWPFYAILHRFGRPDQGDPHDHKFQFRTFILRGGYVERVYHVDGTTKLIERKVGDSFEILANERHIHRVEKLPNGECWTLIIPGPAEPEPREWGFYQWRGGQPYHRFWHEPDFKPLQVES